MSAALSLALPSKGRLKEQTEAWLHDCGLGLEMEGDRSYAARLRGIDGVEVRLSSAAEIAQALEAGDVHLGVTGEDMIRERGETAASEVALLAGLGFGRADLVVAAPKSWIDVETLSDVHEVAGLYLARTGQRLRVATKYGVQTRAFFARAGLADYRIVDSAGATEGAPAAGAAELVVDITTTGATLEANNLKIVGGGVILRSQAQLAASLTASWSRGAGERAARFLRVVEARARAKTLSALTWPAAVDTRARKAAAGFLERGASVRPCGLLTPAAILFEVVEALAASGVADVEVTRPHYVFAPPSAAMQALKDRLAI